MDALARLRQELTRSRHAWQESSDPVRRMALLRELFCEVHRLYNEVLVDRAATALDEVREVHELLERIPGALERLDSSALKALLSQTAELPDFLRGLQLGSGSNLPPFREGAGSSGSDSTPAQAVPEFLDRPDRSWERLIWRSAAGSTQWRLETKIETVGLREFAASAQERERKLSQEGVVLAVTCLTSSGDIRDWQWHYLSPKGDQP